MLERLRAIMRAKLQRNFLAVKLASWVLLLVCLDWPGIASASVYPDGFVWQRAGDWKTSGGTPTMASKLDSQGNVVWNYSWVSGGDFIGSSGTDKWWKLARTDLTSGQWYGADVFLYGGTTLLSNPVTVSYATADGTAMAASDYAPASGTLTFPPGGYHVQRCWNAAPVFRQVHGRKSSARAPCRVVNPSS